MKINIDYGFIVQSFAVWPEGISGAAATEPEKKEAETMEDYGLMSLAEARTLMVGLTGLNRS